MIKELLPIGSIVMLKDGSKRVMIFGVKQSDFSGDKTEYDYVAVLYPEGNVGTEYQFLFNHEEIDEIYFRGYEDEERKEFIEKLEEVYEDKGTFK